MHRTQRIWTRLVLVGSLVGGLGLSGLAHAQSVTVQGNSRVDSETVRSYFTSTDAAGVAAGEKALRDSGLFSSVRVSRRGSNVVVQVSENNIINNVAFEGNSKVKGDQLRPELQLRSRGPFSPSVAAADVERIREIYKRSGRAAAKVSYRTVNLPNGRIDVVYTIDEGDKTGVKVINFSGNQAYSTGKLVGLMQTTEMNFLSFLKNTDVYDPDRISSDLELIRRYYLKNGYADFQVVGNEAHFDPAQGGYVVNIAINEGPQYRVSNVSVQSHLPEVPGETLMPLVRLTRPIKVSRAVMPGTSNRAPSTPSAMNQNTSSPVTASTIASPATDTAEPISARTDIRRRPTLSIRWPPAKAASAAGTALTAATMPARAGSPVRSSTSQGSTIAIEALPKSEVAVAAR